MKLTSPFVLIGGMIVAICIVASISSRKPAQEQTHEPTTVKPRPAAAGATQPSPSGQLAPTSPPAINASQPGRPGDQPMLPVEDPIVAEAVAVVREGLKDPLSAQFRKLEINLGARGTKVVCGEVNAKNGFGGYVGFQRFSVIFSPGQDAVSWVDKPGEELAAATCDAVAGA